MSGLDQERRVISSKENAKSTSRRDDVFHAILAAIATEMTWRLIQVPIWGRVLIFVGVMFLIGAVGQYVKIRAQP
jgi:hypothetical protein